MVRLIVSGVEDNGSWSFSGYCHTIRLERLRKMR